MNIETAKFVTEQYAALENRCMEVIRATKSHGPYAWLPIISGDIEEIYALPDGTLHVSGRTWTMQTGGSYEFWEFDLDPSTYKEL